MSERDRPSYTLTILLAINILNFFDRQVAGTLSEPIRKEFHLSDAQLGGISFYFTVVYAVVGLPLGRLADRFSRKKLLAGGVAVWSVLTALSGFAASYSMLVFTRLGVAVGEAVCAPTAASWLGDLFPASKRARALAIFMLGVPIGSALSNLVAGPAAQLWGWRTAIVLAAAPAVLLTPILLRLGEPGRGAAEERRVTPHSASPWSVLRIPTLWWIIASGALINFNLYTLGVFMPAFLIRVHGFSLARAGFLTGIGWGVAGVVAAISAGYAGDRIIAKRRNGRMLLAAATTFLAAPAAWIAILQPAGSGWTALILLSAAYGFLNTYYGLVYSSIQDIVPPAVRGTTMAIYFMAMYLLGASFGPLLTGRLSDVMAHRAAAGGAITEAAKAIGLHQAMIVVPILSAALALVLYMGSRTITRDIREVGQALPPAQVTAFSQVSPS